MPPEIGHCRMLSIFESDFAQSLAAGTKNWRDATMTRPPRQRRARAPGPVLPFDYEFLTLYIYSECRHL